MRINQFKAFIEISEKGSFSQAAESLFLTQPAISKRIASLEDYFSTKLFDRTHKQAVLTEAGHLLLPRARQMLSYLDDSKRVINDMGETTQGQLSIATSHHIGLRRLPDYLRTYQSRYPEVTLDFHFMDSEEACKLVAEGRVEMGIVTLPLDSDPVLQQSKIWTDQLSLCCAITHPLADLDQLSLIALCKYDAILPGKETFTRQIVDRKMKALQRNVHIAMETNYLETLRTMAAVGLGWTVLPENMISGDIMKLNIPDWGISRDLGIIQHNKLTLSKAAQVMKQLLMCDTHESTRQHGDIKQ